MLARVSMCLNVHFCVCWSVGPPEVDLCLGFRPRSGPMPGFFYPDVDYCRGFSIPKVYQCLSFSPLGFSVRSGPMRGFFSPEEVHCLGFSPQKWTIAWVFCQEVDQCLGFSSPD